MSSSDEAVQAAATVLNPLLARYRHEARDARWWKAACDEARELLDAAHADRRAFLKDELAEGGGGILPCEHCGGTTFDECLATPSCTGPSFPHIQKTAQAAGAFAHVCKRSSVENGMTGVLDE